MERRLKIDGTQVENELAGRGSAGGKKSPVEIGRVEAKGKRTVGVNGAPHCQTSAYGLHRISLTASHSHLRISLTGAQLIHSINNCIDLLLPHALHLGPLFSFLDHAIGLRLQRQRRVSFPFFILELKAAAGTGGNLWDAANQCAGRAAACFQAIDQLNTALGAVGCQGRIPSLCYSLDIDNNLGQLHASWKNGSLIFYIQRVASFLLSDVLHLNRLCACVAAILEWGATTRLQDICVAADYIGSQSQK